MHAWYFRRENGNRLESQQGSFCIHFVIKLSKRTLMQQKVPGNKKFHTANQKLDQNGFYQMCVSLIKAPEEKPSGKRSPVSNQTSCF